MSVEKLNSSLEYFSITRFNFNETERRNCEVLLRIYISFNILNIHKFLITDATNLRKEYREQLITLSHNYNALTKLLVFLDKESNIRKKDKGRKWSVSDSVIDKQIKSWQFPFETETHIVKYIHI